MFLRWVSRDGSIAPVGNGGIGWPCFWSLRRGLGRRSGASSTWQSFAGPADLSVPGAAGGRLCGLRDAPGVVNGLPSTRRKLAPPARGFRRRRRDSRRGFFAGNARIAVLPAATAVELGAFLKDNVAAGSRLLTDGFAGYRGRDAALAEHLKHTPVVQDEAANAGASSQSSIPSSATSKPG